MTPAEPRRKAPGKRDVFASGAYWREYYTSLGHENREAGEFLLEVAASLSPNGGLRIIDAGCGPTLLYWSVFMPGENEIHGFDISPTNVENSGKHIDAAKRGVFDSGLLEAARHTAGLMADSASPECYLAGKARQVASLKVGDLSKRWSYESGRFDLVQSCFALENLPDWPSFDAALAEASRVLRPGGCLALVNGLEGTNWICDDEQFPTLFVTADDMRTRLERHGLRVDAMRDVASTDPSWRDQGYNKVLLTAASKSNAA